MRRPAQRPDRPAVLVLRALGLGDLFTGLPALRAVRSHFPDHELVLAAPERLREAVERCGCADRMLATEAGGRAVPEKLGWHEPPPDVAVNLHGKGPQSSALLGSLGPGQLLSFGPSGPTWTADEHERVRWCRMLGWYGIRADPDDFLLPRPPEAFGGRRPVVLHPGADAAARRWPTARFARLATMLKNTGIDVVITAGRGEGGPARRIAARAGLGPEAVFGGDRDIPFSELVDLVGRAGALVSGDTGIAHLAVSLATPSVTLFGPVSPALWGPPPHSRHAALWPADPGRGLRPGNPAGTATDERLLRISVEDVLDALVAVTSAGQDRVGRPPASPGGGPTAHSAGFVFSEGG